MRYRTTKDKSVTRIRAHCYGDSGVGKTTSLGTLPESCTLIATAERGLLPLRKSSYPVVSLESWDDVRELVREMQDPQAFLGKLREAGVASEQFTDIRVLAIDSLTELSDMCKAQIVANDRKKLMADRKNTKPLGVYDDLMVQEDWNLYGTRMRQMISAMCHLDAHVIMTGLASWTEDKRTGAVLRTPALNGKMATECAAYFDLVMHMEASESKGEDGSIQQVRLWRTFNDGRVIAKDGSGALDPMEVADWSAVFSKIVGTNGKDKA